MSSSLSYKLKPIITFLKKRLPLNAPLRVYVKDLTTELLCGYCLIYPKEDQKTKRYVIAIHNSLPFQTAVDTLLHEYAHALDNGLNGKACEQHRDSWGVCYAKTWRAYLLYLNQK